MLGEQSEITDVRADRVCGQTALVAKMPLEALDRDVEESLITVRGDGHAPTVCHPTRLGKHRAT